MSVKSTPETTENDPAVDIAKAKLHRVHRREMLARLRALEDDQLAGEDCDE